MLGSKRKAAATRNLQEDVDMSALYKVLLANASKWDQPARDKPR